MTKVSALYLHIPFCKHLCNYCDFYKVPLNSDSSQFESFHQLLKDEWNEHQNFLSENQLEWTDLDTLYFGGGTPSLWGIKGAEFFQTNILKHIKLASNCEFTMEVDPGSWKEEDLLKWKSLGLNRISIGTQVLDSELLKVMDRSHSLEESLELLQYCHDHHWNYSLDFLLGIPFSKEKNRNIIRELELFLSYKPKHVSLYILNARSKYPHINEIPDDDFIREEYLKVSEYLISKGFIHYEVSNFALPGFESRHNQKYWQSETVTALGPTGTGYVQVRDDLAIRYKWKVSKAKFEKEILTEKELSLEKTYLSLRTIKGWKPDVSNPKLDDLFSRWEQLGFGKRREDGTMILNSLGFLMLDSLMNDLFILD